MKIWGKSGGNEKFIYFFSRISFIQKNYMNKSEVLIISGQTRVVSESSLDCFTKIYFWPN